MQIRYLALSMCIAILARGSAIACEATDSAAQRFVDDLTAELAGDSPADALARGCPPEMQCTQPYNSSPLFQRMIPGPTEIPNPVFIGGGCHMVIKTPSILGTGNRR